jgi:hypothetical protein
MAIILTSILRVVHKDKELEEDFDDDIFISNNEEYLHQIKVSLIV